MYINGVRLAVKVSCRMHQNNTPNWPECPISPYRHPFQNNYGVWLSISHLTGRHEGISSYQNTNAKHHVVFNSSFPKPSRELACLTHKYAICTMLSLSSSACNLIFSRFFFRSIWLVIQAISNNAHTFHSACSLSLKVSMSPTLVCLPLPSLCLSYILISFSMATLPIEFTIQDKF